jgi:hypothetical protein
MTLCLITQTDNFAVISVNSQFTKMPSVFPDISNGIETKLEDAPFFGFELISLKLGYSLSKTTTHCGQDR